MDSSTQMIRMGANDVPVGPRATLDLAAVADIAARYDLRGVGRAEDVGGTYNQNLRVRTDRGTVIIRVYRPWVTPERLMSVQKVRATLAQEGVPAVVALPNRDGTTIMRHGERLVEVEPFVVHDAIADSWQRCAMAFAMLGRLHATLDAHVDPASVVPPVVRNDAAPAELARWTDETVRRIEPTPPSSGDSQTFRTLATAQVLLRDLSVWWEQAGIELPRQLGHGDWGSGNVLFWRDAVVALLDFDFVAVRERVFDLAYGLFWMFVKREGARTPERWSWHRVPHMLAAYERSTHPPLSASERAALLPELVRVPLYWVGEAAFLPDPVRALADVAPLVEAARWIHTHADAVCRRTGCG